jgi:endoglucanase
MCGKLIYLVSLVLVLGLASNTNAQIVTNSTEDFETNDFSKFPWQHYRDANWVVTSWQSLSGIYSAQAGAIKDDERTTLQVRLDCASGNITFYLKVSSESGFDRLKFFIDGEEQGDWSGEEDWFEVSFPVDEGTRIFEWTYSKDGSTAEGDDTAWIDYIVFPLNNTSDKGGPLPLTASVEITTWQDNKRGACSFTFDDNLNTQFTHFIPKFQELGFVGTFFLVTDWSYTISDYAGVLNSGWEIGSHTVSHARLTELSNSPLRSELADSRATLEAAFALPPGLTLAYPFSDSNTRVQDMTAQYYIAARGGWGRTISPDMSQWSLDGYNRFNLPSYGWTASGHDLDAMNSATDRAISRGEWIVEMIHGTNGDGWEPPDWTSVYEPHFDYVASRETSFWIDTFGNVYRYIAERDACRVSVQAVAGGTAVVLTNESTLPPTPVPLTIKIDIPDQWISVTITDNGNVLSGRIITENQNKYYLVDTIPTVAPKKLLVSGNTKLVKIPFKRGVNLTNWLQASNTRQIHFYEFTKLDLINIKSLGCDVIRLPINLHYMTSGPPDYTIDPLFYSYLDQIIDWTEELGLHLILDNHTFDPAVSTAPNINSILVPVWTQMARHYKDRSNLIYYEVLNEPHGISDARWNEIQQEVIDAIRAIDRTHTIVVGPAEWNSYRNLMEMPVYADDNLIYTFHFYDPYIFTHQGVGPPSASLESIVGLPFPYDASRMPERPTEFVAGTWERDRWENYPHEGTVEHVKGLMDTAVDFQRTRNVPLLCGEFGVYIPYADNEDRVRWYGVVRRYLEEKGIAWTMWDYKGPFHIFEKGSPLMFNHDLNVPLIEALGLTVPPQQEFVLMPETNGFDLYLDHEAPGMIINNWVSQGVLDFYSENNPAIGYFCIHWAGIKQYHPLTFKFSPIRDLSILVDEGFAIDFWIRCNDPDAKIDIRFLDTKTDDPGDRPWRMRYTIDRNVAVWNGQWNHLQIPLNEFSEMGSWDNDSWHNPVGAFDWTATERFEIVPEYGDLEGIHFYFDDIRVVDTKSPGRP